MGVVGWAAGGRAGLDIAIVVALPARIQVTMVDGLVEVSRGRGLRKLVGMDGVVGRRVVGWVIRV